MTELTLVANKHNTDKGTLVHSDFSGHGSLDHHGFTEFYDSYFQKYKTLRPCILEIGIAEGGSVKMTNEYFHGNCDIYCVDISESCSGITECGDNIHFYLLDQGDKDSLLKFKELMNDLKVSFDIILDDGSHYPEHQMLTYSILNDLVKQDGMYIMEDLHTSYSILYNGSSDLTHSPLEFFTQFVPYYMFSDEENLEMFKRIKSTITFNNRNVMANETEYNTTAAYKVTRGITAIITYFY